MFNFKKVTNYRINELENKIIALEKAIDTLNEYIHDVQKKAMSSAYSLDKKIDELERKHEEAIDKQNIRIEELFKPKATTTKKKVSASAKPESTSKS